MTLQEFKVDASSLSGIIAWRDEKEMLCQNTYAKGFSSDNPESYSFGQVALTEAGTGTKYYCYYLNDHGAEEFDFDLTGGTDDNGEARTVEFKSKDSLKPDTNYLFTVTAYYSMNGTIFSREFISRSFYTDSLGVLVEEVGVTANSATVALRISDTYKKDLLEVNVFLLTPEQNLRFSTVTTDYVGKYTLASISSTPVLKYEIPNSAAKEVTSAGYSRLVFHADGTVNAAGQTVELSSDTEYVVRVSAKTTSNPVDSATYQELQLKTLKRSPTYSSNDPISVFYNRTSGEFQIYHPSVIDADKGVVRYEYDVFQKGDGGAWEKVKTVSVSSDSLTGYASCYLGVGNYYVKGRMVFDNNKTVSTYEFKESDDVDVTKGGLPTLLWTSVEQGLNKMKTTLTIDNTESAYVVIDPNKYKLYLTLRADGVRERKIQIDTIDGTDVFYHLDSGEKITEASAFEEKRGSLRYSCTKQGEDGWEIHLDVYNLLANTKYTLEVDGYMRSTGEESSDPYLRDLGTVSLSTTKTYTLRAAWTDPKQSPTYDAANSKLEQFQITRYLSLMPTPEDKDENGNAVLSEAQKLELEALEDGAVTLKLYKGPATSMLLAGRALLDATTDPKDPTNTSAQYEDLFTEQGLLITETTLGVSGSLTEGASYILEVSLVTDCTAALKSEGTITYQNEIPVDQATYRENIDAKKVPPSLTKTPDKGVTATPILNNGQASYWSATRRYDLEDDAVLGYALSANYDNDQMLATSVTYYAFEYKHFYDLVTAMEETTDPGPGPIAAAIASNDPTGGTVLFKTTLPVDSREIPKIVLLFGDDPENTNWVQPSSGGAYGFGQSKVDKGKVNNDDYTLYYAGAARQNDQDLLIGMDRGYRYVFAYTVEYKTQESSEKALRYPDQFSAQYLEYIKYGCGDLVPNRTLGQDKVYVLNSGVMSAPKAQPTFYSYVYKASATSMDGLNTSGELELHYSYDDPDDSLEEYQQGEGGTVNGGTEFSINMGDGGTLTDTSTKHYVGESPYYTDDTNSTQYEEGHHKWYKLNCNYRLSGATSYMQIALKYSTYRIDYSGLITNSDPRLNVASIPLERGWGGYFGDKPAKEKIYFEIRDDYYDQDYIQLRVGGENSRNLFARAVSLTITVEDFAGNKKNISASLRSDQEGYYAIIPINELTGTDAAYDDQSKSQYTFTVNAVYDTGDAGWGIPADDELDGFLMQHYTQSGIYLSSGYMNAYGSNSGVGGSQLKKAEGYSFNLSSFRKTAWPDAIGTHDTVSLKLNGYGGALEPKYYIDNEGVVQSGVVNYAMPKRYQKMTVLASNGDPSITKNIEYIAPQLLQYGTSWKVTFSTIQIMPQINEKDDAGTMVNYLPPKIYNMQNAVMETVNGVEGFYLWAALYPYGDDSSGTRARHEASTLADIESKEIGKERVPIPVVRNEETNAGTLQFSKATDDDGTPLADENGNHILVPYTFDLKKYIQASTTDTSSYYIVFYMKYRDKNGTEGYYQPLRDWNSTGQAIYSKTTLGRLTFSNLRITLNNNNYFDKTLHVEFNMDRTTDVELQAMIFDGSNAVVERQATIKNVIKARSGSLDVDISPVTTTYGKNLKSGQSYRVCLVAEEKSTDSEAGGGDFHGYNAAGHTKEGELTFTMPRRANTCSALIQVRDVQMSAIPDTSPVEYQTDAITFRVTVNDPQYCLMGSNTRDIDTPYAYGLYTVRFTDGGGRWIDTYYDDYVYNVKDGPKEFTIRKNTLKDASIQTLPNGVDGYEIHVLAVTDEEHKGFVSLKSWDPVENNNDAEGKDPDLDKDSTNGEDLRYMWRWSDFYKDVINWQEIADAHTNLGGASAETFSQFLGRFWKLLGSGSFHEKETGTDVEYNLDQFVLRSRFQKLPDKDGVLMGNGTIKLQGGNLVLTLKDTYGLTQGEGQNITQSATEVRWDISDDAYYGGSYPLPKDTGGTFVPGANGNPGFVSTESGVYTLTIPANLPTSNYYYPVTIQVWVGQKAYPTSTILSS